MTCPNKAAAPIPDLLGRDFNAARIDQKWCGDLTEIPTDEGKLYLATVEDLASRRLPGFAIGEHHDSQLARAALCMAAATRGGTISGVIFHSDKGGEYVGDLFSDTCKALRGGPVDGLGRRLPVNRLMGPYLRIPGGWAALSIGVRLSGVEDIGEGWRVRRVFLVVLAFSDKGRYICSDAERVVVGRR